MPKTKKAKSRRLPKVGSKDFTNRMYQGSPSWYVFAVESSLDKVTDAFTKLREAADVHRDVPITTLDGDETVGLLVPVLELAGSSWVIVQRATGILTSQIIQEHSEDAKLLSKRLKTRAVSFIAERHSGSAGYELYDAGKLNDRAIWAEAADVISKRADGVFCDLGVYFPVCFGCDEDEPSLAVEKSSAGRISRAHLVELENWG